MKRCLLELIYLLEVIPQGKLNIEDAIEDGLSFIENAIIKARHASRISVNLPLQMTRNSNSIVGGALALPVNTAMIQQII